MKIFCNKSDINKAITNVLHSVPSKTTSPILEGILAEVEDGIMKLTATDTNITIESSLAVTSDNDGSFVVPAKLFASIISKLPEEEIMIEHNFVKNKVLIKSGGSSSEIITFAADDFPKIILNEDEDNKLKLSKEDVKKLIRKTSFSASNDDFNGILTGVLLDIREGYMKMVGVDPFRIATYKVEVSSDEEISVVIPAKLINEVAKIISDEGEDAMTVEIIDKKVLMIFDNNRVTVNTFSGKYIDYERILNKRGNINVRVKKDDLLKSIDRASLLTTAQNNNLIKLNIKNDVAYINSLNNEGNIEEKVEIINDGDDLLIGINSKYLKDALSAVEDEEIIINFKDSVSPCIINPLKGDKYNYLVLPIRIN